ncbi:MAG: response regulator [Chloroflexi bacterium]|nr:response regulator [Chloroflexota bacterium]
MDIRLKGDMDGVEAAQQLRKRFDVAVIYLTAYADETTLGRAKVTEPFGYLIKPFDERELHSTVEMALYKITSEKRLRAHAVRLKEVISTVPDGVALLDADRRVELANAKACDFLNILSGSGIGDVVDRLGEKPIEQILSLPADRNWHEIRLDGSPQRVFEVNVSFLQTESTRARVQFQDHLAAIGQFAAGIAHDFNNILSSILLQPYLIMKTEPNLSEVNRDRLGFITNQVEHANSLVKQVLDFSRASETEMKPINLVPLLKELATLLERMLPETIRLELTYQVGDCTISGDVTRLSQMMMNLALNARDAMPDGGTLKVDLTRISAPDALRHISGSHEEWIRIAVSDTGTGIPPEIMHRVFEPFFTTKEPDKGTGLGLSQVYGVVRQHGGHIDVEIRVGQGSTFSIHMPALSHSSSTTVRFDNEEPSLALGDGQTVLLVEDNLDTRESTKDVLELSNFQVLTASNGYEALTMLGRSETKVDLVISDRIMPGMGGLELCRELRRKKNPVRVIILTGYATDEVHVELRTLGVIELLTKPVAIDRLLDVVARSCSMKS